MSHLFKIVTDQDTESRVHAKDVPDVVQAVRLMLSKLRLVAID